MKTQQAPAFKSLTSCCGCTIKYIKQGHYLLDAVKYLGTYWPMGGKATSHLKVWRDAILRSTDLLWRHRSRKNKKNGLDRCWSKPKRTVCARLSNTRAIACHHSCVQVSQ